MPITQDSESAQQNCPVRDTSASHMIVSTKKVWGEMRYTPVWFKTRGRRVVHDLAFRNFSLRISSRRRAKISEILSLIRPLATELPLVRVGGDGDGGYLLPRDWDGLAGVISPGVGEVSEFETFFSSLGVPCFLFDGSVTEPEGLPGNILFTRKFIGETVSENSITFEEALHFAPGEGDLLLQMDIEGDEWSVLQSLQAKSLLRFRTLVVEFHDFDTLLFSSWGIRLVQRVLETLLIDFYPVHVHINNCCGYTTFVGPNGPSKLPRVIEVTLHRKDRVSHVEYFAVLPSDLDSPNLPDVPDAVLPLEWRAEAWSP